MADVKGFSVDEVAEISKQSCIEEFEKCKNHYNKILAKQKEIDKMKIELERLQSEQNEMIADYRVCSVDRVLEYIRHKGITDARELDVLLCHCQNKLMGNIDGTELDLNYEVEDEL